MKKKLLAALLIVVAAVCLCACALAAEDNNLKISMALSANKFSEPTEITVSITITNAGEGDMPGPVTLYYPNGNQVEEFGSPTLTVGNSASWSGKWKVTKTQLESGRITFKIKYSIYNDDGELVNKTKSFSKAITYTGAVTSVEINRTISPTTAREGQEVNVTYEVVNTGTVDITDVTIKENSSIATAKGTIDKVKSGEKETYTFTKVMGTKDLTSEATITYKAAGKTETVKKEKATVTYGEVKLTATLSADRKGGSVGDLAVLTLKLKNTGNLDFTGVTVTDPTLGTLWTDQTVPAGQTVTLTKDLTLADTCDYLFTVTGTDTAGNELETTTERVTMTVLDPSQAITLTVEAEPDRTVIYTLPGTVKFTISVTNNSNVDVGAVSVYAVNTKLYTFDAIASGDTATFVRDVSISMNGTYAFTARVADQLGQTQTFTSNSNYISYSEPTPVPTEAPIVTPPAPNYETVPTEDGREDLDKAQEIMGVAWKVLAVLAGVLGVLGIAGLISHLAGRTKEADKVTSIDDGGSYRDYSRNAGRKRNVVDNGITDELPVEPEAPAEDETGLEAQPEAPQPEAPAEAPVDPMADALSRIYPDGVPQSEPEVYEVSDEQPAQEQKTGTVTDAGSYARRRRGS